MMRRALLLALCLAALTRCAFRRPVDERVTIDLKDEAQHARVVVDTKLDDRELPPRAAATRARRSWQAATPGACGSTASALSASGS
jgi:hypothetical protein